MEDERADEVEAAAAPNLLHTASNVGEGGDGHEEEEEEEEMGKISVLLFFSILRRLDNDDIDSGCYTLLPAHSLQCPMAKGRRGRRRERYLYCFLLSI